MLPTLLLLGLAAAVGVPHRACPPAKVFQSCEVKKVADWDGVQYHFVAGSRLLIDVEAESSLIATLNGYIDSPATSYIGFFLDGKDLVGSVQDVPSGYLHDWGKVRADKRQLNSRFNLGLVQSTFFRRSDEGQHRLELRARGEGHGSSHTYELRRMGVQALVLPRSLEALQWHQHAPSSTFRMGWLAPISGFGMTLLTTGAPGVLLMMANGNLLTHAGPGKMCTIGFEVDRVSAGVRGIRAGLFRTASHGAHAFLPMNFMQMTPFGGGRRVHRLSLRGKSQEHDLWRLREASISAVFVPHALMHEKALHRSKIWVRASDSFTPIRGLKLKIRTPAPAILVMSALMGYRDTFHSARLSFFVDGTDAFAHGCPDDQKVSVATGAWRGFGDNARPFGSVSFVQIAEVSAGEHTIEIRSQAEGGSLLLEWPSMQVAVLFDKTCHLAELAHA
jgi:hypothetical protein